MTWSDVATVAGSLAVTTVILVLLCRSLVKPRDR